MKRENLGPIFSLSLVALDALLTAVAFILAYQLRRLIPWPNALSNDIGLIRYSGFILIQAVLVLITLFFYGQYVIPRAISRVDQLVAVARGVTVGLLLALGLVSLVFRNTRFEVDYPRATILYAWLLTIVLIMLGRIVSIIIRDRLRDRGLARDRLMIVGTDEVARIILQRILWSPQLGYEVVGAIAAPNGSQPPDEILGVPILGQPADLPRLIEAYDIDEVIIAMPEKGHQETLRIISYCERGRVSIKVFPDIFQFIASEASIDDLGGLPLLTIRDFAMRGYVLVVKRSVDLAGALFGLIFLSPLMLLVAVAIKLESPGPVFFVQERMGLDGKSFQMIKFRSMRNDAEKDGPGWTVDDDPRQTQLGRFLRRVDVDELPQLINVMLGEMSLVGPRPEQPRYVEEFRLTVPRYMERHREKAGMTGWAQVNGLRGDTSIVERTKYDIWYTENWSILLDFKILLRTVWQHVRGED